MILRKPLLAAVFEKRETRKTQQRCLFSFTVEPPGHCTIEPAVSPYGHFPFAGTFRRISSKKFSRNVKCKDSWDSDWGNMTTRLPSGERSKFWRKPILRTGNGDQTRGFPARNKSPWAE